MVKSSKVIAVDIDEILAGFIDYFVSYHNLTYQTKITKNDVFSFNLHEVFGVSREEIIMRMVKFGEEGHNFKIEPVPGAIEGVGALLKKGYILHLVTARPTIIQKDTEKWINKFFPQKFINLHHAFNKNIHKEDSPKKKKWEICKEIGARVLIDDHLDNALSCVENGIKVLLMDAPWNQVENLPKGIKRVKGWEEILTILIPSSRGAKRRGDLVL